MNTNQIKFEDFRYLEVGTLFYRLGSLAAYMFLGFENEEVKFRQIDKKSEEKARKKEFFDFSIWVYDMGTANFFKEIGYPYGQSLITDLVGEGEHLHEIIKDLKYEDAKKLADSITPEDIETLQKALAVFEKFEKTLAK